MKSKQLFFFVTTSDIQSILQKFESSNAVQYIQTGMFDDFSVTLFNSMFNYEFLGYSISGDWNQLDSFLILPVGVKVNIREVPQKRGGLKYAIDQMQNPQSIVFKPGGILREGVIVAGSIGTISDHKYSILLYRNLSNQMKKEFSKIGNFHVGEDAKRKLSDGWRLVTNEKSPKDYDLVLS